MGKDAIIIEINIRNFLQQRLNILKSIQNPLRLLKVILKKASSNKSKETRFLFMSNAWSSKQTTR